MLCREKWREVQAQCMEGAQALEEPAEEAGEESKKLFGMARASAGRAIRTIKEANLLGNAGAGLDGAVEIGQRVADQAGDAAVSAGEAIVDVAKDAPSCTECCAAIARTCEEMGKSVNLMNKIDIIRDFFQMISLFLVRAGRSLVSGLGWFAGLGSIISIDFQVAFPSIPAGFYYGLGAVLAFLFVALTAVIVYQSYTIG